MAGKSKYIVFEGIVGGWKGYVEVAKRFPKLVKKVDGNGTIDVVEKEGVESGTTIVGECN